MSSALKFVVVAVLASTLTGCGWFDRNVAAITGGPTETCVDGVAYLQFTSGATVKYTKDGKIATCK